MKFTPDYQTKALVIFLFLLIIIAVPTIIYFIELYNKEAEEAKNIRINIGTLHWQLFNRSNSHVLSFHLGRSLPSRPLPYYCFGEQTDDTKLCLKFFDNALLYINYKRFDNVDCFNVDWHPLQDGVVFRDGFFLSDVKWYGIGEMIKQNWPLDLKSFQNVLFLTGDIHNNDVFGNTLDAYFLSSNGIAIYIISEYLTAFSFDEEESLFTFEQKLHKENSSITFSYSVCVGSNIFIVHQYMLQYYFSQPFRPPSEYFFNSVIWSTYSKFKNYINQSKISEFAKNIAKHKFNSNLLIIEEGWQKYGGNFIVDSTKFPTFKSFIADLKQLNFNTSFTFNLYFDMNSSKFEETITDDHAIHDISDEVAALVSWKDSVTTILDITNKNSTSWFYGIVRILKFQSDIDFLILTEVFIKQLLLGVIPKLYRNERIRIIYQCTKIMNEINPFIATFGWRTQKFPLIIRISQRDSTWGYNSGLQSVIPTVLTLGILGYPYILPGVIGGYSEGEKPERDLYLRWFQLAICMPFIEMSVAPWDYDSEVIAIVVTLMKFRRKRILPEIMNSLQETIFDGFPIIRPIWWIAPLDAIALTIDNEFLIGNRTLISPILFPNTDKRDIYLPKGKWKDQLNDKIITGPETIKEYKISYDRIAYFSLLDDNF